MTAEFTAWMAARSSARGGVTVLDCTPEDVAVFFESSWLLKHGSMQLAGGLSFPGGPKASRLESQVGVPGWSPFPGS